MPGSVALTIGMKSVTIVQGSTAVLDVTIARNMFTAPLTVTLTGLPAGVTAAPATIAAGASTGSITLTATAIATIGTTSPTLSVASGGGKVQATAPVTLLVRGVPGTLDTTFGTAGVVTSSTLGATASGVALQSTGGIVVTSAMLDPVTGATNNDYDLIAARFTPQGKLDTTFGTAGTQIVVTGGSAADPKIYTYISAPLVAVAADDSVLMLPNGLHANFINPHTAAYHLSKNGVFDAVWGDGTGYLDIFPTPIAVVVQGPNAILLGKAGLGNGKPAAARFATVAGVVEQGYGGSFYASGEQFNAASLITGGGIYACGDYEDPDFPDGGAAAGTSFVARIAANGSLDTAFGSSGIVANSFLSHCKGVVTTKAGDAIMWGDSGPFLNLSHVTTAGVDGNFRYPVGAAARSFGSPKSSGVAAALQGEQPVLLGAGTTLGKGAIILVRTNADGSLDTTFNGSGSTTTTLGATTAAGAVPVAMVLQADGKLVVVGSLDGALMIARFWL
jgi:uncharacterized delta-60 repeat protein